jgi:hypothetical protein
VNGHVRGMLVNSGAVPATATAAAAAAAALLGQGSVSLDFYKTLNIELNSSKLKFILSLHQASICSVCLYLCFDLQVIDVSQHELW